MAAGSGGGGGGDFPLPDFSKPPPGFGPSSGPAVDPATGLPPMPATLDLTPSVPYYDLPAGLMAPLVKVDLPYPYALLSVFIILVVFIDSL